MGEIRQRSSNGGPAQTVRLIGCSLFGKCFLVEFPSHEKQPILPSQSKSTRCRIAERQCKASNSAPRNRLHSPFGSRHRPDSDQVSAANAGRISFRRTLELLGDDQDSKQ